MLVVSIQKFWLQLNFVLHYVPLGGWDNVVLIYYKVSSTTCVRVCNQCMFLFYGVKLNTLSKQKKNKSYQEKL